MMLIQLQLSTVNSASSNAAKRSRTSVAGSSISRQTHVSSTTTQATAAAAASAAASAAAANAASAAAAAHNAHAATSETAQADPAGAETTSTGESYKPKLNTRALTEASKNLTKTLKQLSSEVLTNKVEEVRIESYYRGGGN